MIIETKFNVGDKVFISKNDTFEESEVTEISIYIKDSIRINYSIKSYFLRFFSEHELFKSKEELLERFNNLKDE